MAVVWKERLADETLVADLVGRGFSPLQARILALRGISAATVDAYFNPKLADLSKPDELPGIREAVSRILPFVTGGKTIVVFGDYDCDGVCATAILVKAITVLGGCVKPFIPRRLTEGFGMNDASVARMLSENPGVELVVTVDNGINSVEQVAELKEKGISVVVTDHHLPGEELPDCTIVNPKVRSPESLQGLCGAGVAFLLAGALIAEAKARGCYTGPNVGGPMLVLAGLATVTDIMPMMGQNRILVTEALKRFRSWAPVGLKELYDRASRTTAAALTVRDFGFLIGPRINAAGRVASGMEALDLVLSSDREQAREFARAVDIYNTERKTIEQKMTELALAQVVEGASAQIINFEQQEAHSGVAGIVASRILERLTGSSVPVCVIVGGHGSARSPEGYNVRDAFVHAAEALTRFGGHAAAGGFTVREGCLERFRELFSEACRQQASSVPVEEQGVDPVDAEIDGRELDLDFATWLQSLEPFGEGNQMPVFVIRKAWLSDVRPLGQDGKHLQVSFRGGTIPRAVWWGHGDLVERLRAESGVPYDLAFTVEVSTYGEPHPELRLVGIQKS